MTQDVSTTGYSSPAYTEGPDASSSTKDVAKDQAASVAGSAAGAGQHVAQVAKDQAGNVATEATRQAKDVVGQARAQLSQQASDQQQRVAGGLRSIGTELNSMAERSDQSGLATDLARQASSKAHELADWLEQRDPSGLLDEVKTFARRRPGAFLAVALGAGLAAGRLTRGIKDESSSGPSGSAGYAAGYTPGYSAGYSTGATTTGATATGYTTATGYDTATGYEAEAGFEQTAPGFTSPPVNAPATGAFAETEYVETAYPATEGTPGAGTYDRPVSSTEVYESPYTEDTAAYADEDTRVEKTTYTEPTYRDEENR